MKDLGETKVDRCYMYVVRIIYVDMYTCEEECD